MAVSVAVCEIFSVKEWCDLENRVRVRPRSLEMAPFDRSHTSSYSPSTLIMATSCIVQLINQSINQSMEFVNHPLQSLRDIVKMFDAGKIRMIGLLYSEKL